LNGTFFPKANCATFIGGKYTNTAKPEAKNRVLYAPKNWTAPYQTR